MALSTIVAAAALDPSVQLTLLDGKHVELIAWSDVADEFVGADQEAAVAALEDLRDIMDDRYALLAHHRRRKMASDDLEGLHVLVIDELAFYLRGGKKVLRDQFGELLRDLVSRGRAAGIIVIATTQKPSHEIVPTWIRDLFSFRLAMRCTSSDSSDTILGQGWASQGYSAATIDPSMRGAGYLLAEGGVPTLVMTPYLNDEEIAGIADRAYELRYADERGRKEATCSAKWNSPETARIRFALQGEMVNLTTGEVGVNSLHISCKDRRAVICPSCSYTYKADAWILVSTGLVGGKGTPEEVSTPSSAVRHIDRPFIWRRAHDHIAQVPV